MNEDLVTLKNEANDWKIRGFTALSDGFSSYSDVLFYSNISRELRDYLKSYGIRYIELDGLIRLLDGQTD